MHPYLSFLSNTQTWVSLKENLINLQGITKNTPLTNVVGIQKTLTAGFAPISVLLAAGDSYGKAAGVGIKESIMEFGKLAAIPWMVSYGTPVLGATLIADSVARGAGYVVKSYVDGKEITMSGMAESMLALPIIANTAVKPISDKFNLKEYLPSFVTTVNKFTTKVINDGVKTYIKDTVKYYKSDSDETKHDDAPQHSEILCKEDGNNTLNNEGYSLHVGQFEVDSTVGNKTPIHEFDLYPLHQVNEIQIQQDFSSKSMEVPVVDTPIGEINIGQFTNPIGDIYAPAPTIHEYYVR